MRPFASFVRDGIVRQRHTDSTRAAALREEAEKRRLFLQKMVQKIPIDDENANYFIETAYDIMMELIRSRLFAAGFKAAGIAAHEAEVSYLRELGCADADVRFANDLRYFRNGIVYYGKRLDAAYAHAVLAFLERLYAELSESAL